MEKRFYLTLCNEAAHVGHPTGKNAVTNLPIDKKLIESISEKVKFGIRTLGEMKRSLNDYVHNVLFKDQQPPDSGNRRFFPTDSDILNHMHQTMLRNRRAFCDQENVGKLIDDWRDTTDDFFFYRPYIEECSAEDSTTTVYDEEKEIPLPSPNTRQPFVFVHQTKFQSRLLNRYGNELTLMDATYKTMKWDMPVFQLVVKTATGSLCVANFITHSETSIAIWEALTIIQSWNPQWKPRTILIDFCEAEINAVHEVFGVSCKVLICDFHREQAWERWLRTSSNGSSDNKEPLLLILRKIAHSSTVEEYELNLDKLRKSEYYQSSEKLKNYIERTWIPHSEKWVRAFRQERLLVNVNSNNATERYNRILKEKYLGKKTNVTLSHLVQTIVNVYAQGEMNKYLHENMERCSTSRRYASYIPVYLYDRPIFFIQHCLEMMKNAKETEFNDIHDINPVRFQIVSQTDKNRQYSVFFGSESDLPSCECKMWLSTKLPCKHMFAVIQCQKATWNTFPSHYRGNVFFNIDKDILDGINTPDLLAQVNEVNASQPSPLIITNDNLESDVPENDELSQDAPSQAHENPVNNTLPTESLPNIKKLASQFRETLKELNNVSYRLESAEIFIKSTQTLAAVLNEMSSGAPNDSGIPSFITIKSGTKAKVPDSCASTKKADSKFEKKNLAEDGCKLVQSLLPSVANDEIETKVSAKLLPLSLRRPKSRLSRVGSKADRMKKCGIIVVPQEFDEMSPSNVIEELHIDLAQELPLKDCDIHPINGSSNGDSEIDADLQIVSEKPCPTHLEKPPTWHEDDYIELRASKELGYAHINTVQYMIREKFPKLDGLQNTSSSSSNKFVACQGRFVQIIFIKPEITNDTGKRSIGHWICVSSIDCLDGEVNLYDSLYCDSIAPSVWIQIASHLNYSGPKIKVNVMPIQQQGNCYDCSRFAIANAIELAHGGDPCKVTYDTNNMNNHLISIFESKNISPFPKSLQKVKKCVKKTKSMRIYCKCRKPWFEVESDESDNLDMVSCSTCKGWYHKACESIPSHVFEKTASRKKWNCSTCLL